MRVCVCVEKKKGEREREEEESVKERKREKREHYLSRVESCLRLDISKGRAEREDRSSGRAL